MILQKKFLRIKKSSWNYREKNKFNNKPQLIIDKYEKIYLLDNLKKVSLFLNKNYCFEIF